jgi:ribosomal-protein-alanine N-acetyltransferase
MKGILQTPRVALREFELADAEALAKVLSDPETMRFFPTSFDQKAIEEWIVRNRRRYEVQGHGLWAMQLKSTGEMIGDCGIAVQDVEGEQLLEVGYHLRRDMWGQGFATEAARACRDYGFRKMQAEFMISLVRPENVASCRVAERCGMKVWKETLRAGLRHLVYRILREEWEAGAASHD